ncbi:male-enhanced antigen 1 [Syngnathus acus]|uniref:male-enhanced antigen 1 n=1 Tax=Syngnathus acus TaxID=161584 RepID=UPI001885DD1B|nr:male-enhanced antigen 1 [Syngnathus acus]
MGPERVFPLCEDDDKNPCDGDAVSGAAWSGGEEDQEGEGTIQQVPWEEDGGGYSYQPLNQDGDDTPNLQHRMEVMGLHLLEAPPSDNDEDNPEEAAAERSRASIPMDAAHVELVKRTMAAVALPLPGVPSWAQEISDDQWRDVVRRALSGRRAAALRCTGLNNT